MNIEHQIHIEEANNSFIPLTQAHNDSPKV